MLVKEMENFAAVAVNLWKVLRVRFVYQLDASLADLVNKSIAAKMGTRQRPTLSSYIVNNLALGGSDLLTVGGCVDKMAVIQLLSTRTPTSSSPGTESS